MPYKTTNSPDFGGIFVFVEPKELKAKLFALLGCLTLGCLLCNLPLCNLLLLCYFFLGGHNVHLLLYLFLVSSAAYVHATQSL